MRVLHVPYCFHPDPHGGTEVYAESLAQELQKLGMECEIAAPGKVTESYEVRGLRVHRYALSPRLSLEEQYGEGDPVAAAEFGKVLERVRPDVVHLHAFTAGVSLRVVRMAKAKGIPVMVTYHTPTVTCARGTLLRWGRKICDGKLDAKLCAACSLHGHGLPKPVAQTLVQITSVLPRIQRSGGVWTALRMHDLMRLRHEAARNHLAEADHVVAVCEWVRQLLIRNGIVEEKVTLCRQGVANAPKPGAARVRKDSEPLKVAFFGRLDPTKGVHVLVDAVRQIPQANLELDIYGVTQGASGVEYESRIRRMAEGDRRIRFCAPVPQDEVGRTLKAYDLLAVPSQSLETGPLVVYEAMAVGVRVLGSRLGGVEELVDAGWKGTLVRPDRVQEWAEQLATLAGYRQASVTEMQLSGSRTMTVVAGEMLPLYRRICPERLEAVC